MGTAANAVIMGAYLAVSATIARSLVVTGQLRGNRLGAATAAIFLTCGLGHGAPALRLLHDVPAGGDFVRAKAPELVATREGS